jgi:myo-inositol-1(or 4)-monophosphatase
MERNRRQSAVNPLEAIVAAEDAARRVGQIMRRHLHQAKQTNETTQHDIKLELDVRSQRLIQRTLQRAFPGVPLLGEEGVSGDINAPNRWVVDPIDGTVNFAYGIPHACVSIALQHRTTPLDAGFADGFRTIAGVVYDPFGDEMWTASCGKPARLNGKRIRVSRRARLAETIVSIGFAKTRETLNRTLPYFNTLVHRVRKVRIMGAAALALTYVATGRFDAYIEAGIRLWDIAAGGLILESAGGEFWRRPIAGKHAYRIVASNGRLRRALRVPN